MFDFRFISWESHTNFGVVRGARVSVCSSVKSRIPSREKPLCGQKMKALLKDMFGEVPEWLIGAVSKTVVLILSTGGSNPSLSAGLRKKIKEKRQKMYFSLTVYLFSFFLILLS